MAVAVVRETLLDSQHPTAQAQWKRTARRRDVRNSEFRRPLSVRRILLGQAAPRAHQAIVYDSQRQHYEGRAA